MKRLAGAALVLFLASGCSGNPVGPESGCAYNGVGDLDLVNLSDNFVSRDVYVDGRYVATVPSGSHVVVTVSAGAVHTIEWVSSVTGSTLDITKVAVDACSTTTLTNHF